VSKKPLPVVVIDHYEAHAIANGRPNKTAGHLLCSDQIECQIRPQGEVIADFEVHDRKGNVWGIERKTWTDCYGSILDKRVYGQLSELIERYGERAIFLLEENYVSPKMKIPAYKLKDMVLSFASHRSLLMPVFITSGPAQSAAQIIELARCEIKDSLKARGIIVQKVREL
jgi:ERCC4-type nuclease